MSGKIFSRYEDSIRLYDKISEGAKIPHESTLKTEIWIRDGDSGDILAHESNMTVLGGRLHLLETSFGITPDSTKRLLLNDIMNIPHASSATVLSNGVVRSTRHFMMGNGAESVSTPGTIYTEHNYETKLYSPIPFRCVSTAADLSVSEQANYRLKKVITINNNEYYAYYAKKFTCDTVYQKYNEADYIPLITDTVPVKEGDSTHRLGGGSVLDYVEFTLTISAVEYKEYYKLMNNNSLDGAAINELGLVLAADINSELAAAELFAKMTSSSVPMTSESSSRIVTYRVYA